MPKKTDSTSCQFEKSSVSFGLAFNLPQMSASVSEVMLSQKDEASWSNEVHLGALKIKMIV